MGTMKLQKMYMYKLIIEFLTFFWHLEFKLSKSRNAPSQKYIDNTCRITHNTRYMFGINITFSVPVIQFMLKIYQYMYNTYDCLIFLERIKKNSSYNFWWYKINHSLKYHKFKYTGKEKMYVIHNHVIYKYLKYICTTVYITNCVH